MKNEINDRIINPTVRNSNDIHRTIGRVNAFNKNTNVCEVEYVNKDGAAISIKDAILDLRNDDSKWVPRKDELVVFDANKNVSGVVICKYTEDYTKTEKPKLRQKGDKRINSSPDTCGEIP